MLDESAPRSSSDGRRFQHPAGLAVLQDLTRQVNTLLNEAGPQTRARWPPSTLFRELGGDVLGIVPEREEGTADAGREDGPGAPAHRPAQSRPAPRRIGLTGDTIRDRLKELGVVLEDRADGTIWKLG
jgi:cysteinyl-tRNA synthetase